MQIKTGDNVKVITGKDNGKTGTVLAAYPKKNRVLVEGVNMVTKHAKPSQDNPQGGIESQESAIHISNVMIVDPKTDEPTRVGSKRVRIKGKDGVEKEVNVRVAKKSGEILDKEVEKKMVK